MDILSDSWELVAPYIGLLVATAVIGLATFWWSISGYQPNIKPLVDLNCQTRQLPDGSWVAAFLKENKLRDCLYDDVKTLYEGVRRGLRVSNNGPMLGYRKKFADGTEPYIWISYKEVIDRSLNFAYGLRAIGISTGQNVLVGFYSKNRPEWTIGELAVYSNNSVVVPLYETYGAEALRYIINQCSIEVILCDAEKKASDLMENKDLYPSLKCLVVMDKYGPSLLDIAKTAGLSIHRFEEIEKIGSELSLRPEPQPPASSDLCTVCFTSGTTGVPKGVVLTHGNVIACSTIFLLLNNTLTTPKDTIISYLPLAHMYERLLECVCFQNGGRIGYFRGDIRKLVDDIKELRPTFLPLVPRVLNRIYDQVMTEVNKSVVRKIIFKLAIAWKTRQLKRGILCPNTWIDRLAFKKIRNALGGRVRMALTGSAPIADEVLVFARAAFGCFVLEGYGQTECVAASTGGTEADMNTGHVGIPLPCNAVKLVDVPELGYYVKDSAGEICIKGPNVFKGYYKNEEATKEALDEEGWLHSGDIGRWNPNGTLRVIDRKKHIFKLQQGEYVAPEKIESVYARCQFVAQSFVHGESLKNCLVGIVVPDEEVLKREAIERLGMKNASYEELCGSDDVKKMILDEMNLVAKRDGLFSFEQVKDIFLSPEAFTIENGLLTPTLKNRRPKIKERYMQQIVDMYSRLS